MPLKPGNTPEIIAANIAELIKSGKSKEEAKAIAEAEAKKTKKRKGPVGKI